MRRHDVRRILIADVLKADDGLIKDLNRYGKYPVHCVTFQSRGQ